jgi:hypothetical protein
MTVIRVFMLAAFACVLVSCQTPTDIANRECWSYLDAGQVKSFDACFDRAYAAAAQARDEDAATSRALLSGFAAGEQAKVDAGRAYVQANQSQPQQSPIYEQQQAMCTCQTYAGSSCTARCDAAGTRPVGCFCK